MLDGSIIHQKLPNWTKQASLGSFQVLHTSTIKHNEDETAPCNYIAITIVTSSLLPFSLCVLLFLPVVKKGPSRHSKKNISNNHPSLDSYSEEETDNNSYLSDDDMVTSEDQFAGKAKLFELFLLTHHFYPFYYHKDNRESRNLGGWVARQRQLYCGNKLAHDHNFSIGKC